MGFLPVILMGVYQYGCVPLNGCVVGPNLEKIPVNEDPKDLISISRLRRLADAVVVSQTLVLVVLVFRPCLVTCSVSISCPPPSFPRFVFVRARSLPVNGDVMPLGSLSAVCKGS
jgi:hypothetical protein